ncbi:MAG: hypothetical protein AB7R55_12595 [Gemmatimonadales bacterium]
MIRALCLGLLLAPAGPLHAQAAGPRAAVAYRIHATVDPARAAVTARATIWLPRSLLAEPDSFRLHLGLSRDRRIEVTAVGDSLGRTGAFFLSEDRRSLVAPIEPGTGPAALMVEFVTPLDTTSRSSLGYDLATSVDDAEAWYPAVPGLPDSLRSARSFEVEILAPRGVGVLVSGSLADSVLGEGTTLYRYRADRVAGAALAFGRGYRVVRAADGGTMVSAFARAEQLARFRGIAAATARAAEWYRATYGFFPAEEIGVLPGYRGARGGFPLPNVFMIHQADLSEPFVRWITAHELAHYYWGLWVLDPDERLGWLTLGLGIWTDQLYLARTAGRSIAEQWRRPDADNSLERFLTAELAGHERRLGLPDSAVRALDFDYNSLVRHAKGATAVYLVAERIGADRFVALQQELLASHRHRRLELDEFVERVEAAGFPGARAFLDRWVTGDARFGYAVRRVRADRGRTWIVVERTGTVPYPVTLETTNAAGATERVELTGESPVDSVLVSGAVTLRGVTLDPDGILPMVETTHPEMRRVHLMAASHSLEAAAFVGLATAHLARDPDPHLAARVIEREFERERFQAVFETASKYPAAVTCVDRVRCFAALQVARALARLGKLAGARAWLQNVEPAMAALGVLGGRRLEEAKREILPP